jgi:hypothetical protein
LLADITFDMADDPFELDSSSNPLAPPSGGNGGGDDVETGIGDATLQQQVALLQARMETLERGGGADAAIRSVFASIGTAPANWHQATGFFLSSEKEVDQAMRKRAPLMFVGGLLIIFFQIIVTGGLFVGSLIPSCQSNLQCAHLPGTVCTPANRCFHCGQTGIYPQAFDGQKDVVDCDWGPNEPHVGRSPEPQQRGKCFRNLYRNKTAVAEVCADPQDRLAWQEGQGELNDPIGFKAKGVRTWCEACIFTDGEVNRYTIVDNSVGDIMSMGAYDWVALFFATYDCGWTVDCGRIKGH